MSLAKQNYEHSTSFPSIGRAVKTLTTAVSDQLGRKLLDLYPVFAKREGGNGRTPYESITKGREKRLARYLIVADSLRALVDEPSESVLAAYEETKRLVAAAEVVAEGVTLGALPAASGRTTSVRGLIVKKDPGLAFVKLCELKAPEDFSELREFQAKLRDSISMLNPAQAAQREQGILDAVLGGHLYGATSHSKRDITELVRQHQENERTSKWLVSCRSRLANLKFPAPYRDSWRFLDQILAGSSTAGRDRSEPKSSFRGEHAILIDHQHDTAAQRLAPATSTSQWENVRRFSRPLHTLYSRQCCFDSAAAPQKVSHRIKGLLPSLIRALSDEQVLLHDKEICCADVAPTALNANIPVYKTTYFAATLSTRSVALDAYSEDGARTFDGLGMVEEDGTWLLLRSNHTIKPLLVMVLLVTNDSQVIFSLPRSCGHSSAKTWLPTISGYMIPEDFNSKSELVSAVHACSQRMLRSSAVPSVDYDIQCTGFGLDACYGLRPTFFVLARTKTVESSQYVECASDPSTIFRYHSLVADNPQVSFNELLNLPRYAHADMLQASFYFARQYFELLRRLGLPASVDAIGKLSWAGQEPGEGGDTS